MTKIWNEDLQRCTGNYKDLKGGLNEKELNRGINDKDLKRGLNYKDL